VQKIVDEHGGTVRVGKAPQGGASFGVSLPVSAAANEAQANVPVKPMKNKAIP
jgi:K+-sensing histidine kinase KdpD